MRFVICRTKDTRGFRRPAGRDLPLWRRGTKGVTFISLLLAALLVQSAPSLAGETRFGTFALIVDAGEAPLAAWQVELTYEAAALRIVGVEGGAGPWREAPFYDPKGLEAGRLLLASFTLEAAPPAGATRVARIHVQRTDGGETPLRVKLTAAADPDGRRIGATVRLVAEKGDLR